MPSRNRILAFVAAGSSLALHAAVLSSFRSVRVGGGTPSRERFEEMTVVAAPTDSVAEELDIGEADARGFASHRLEGRHTAVSREAPADQAALSLDPVGDARVVETPGGAPANDGPSRPAEAAPVAQQLNVVDSIRPVLLALRPLEERLRSLIATAPPEGVAVDGSIMPKARLVESEAAPDSPVGPEPVEAREPPAPARPVATAAEAESRQSAASRAGGGASRIGQADPAPLSDSESDAFSVLGSAQFTDGGLRVRSGRKVKSRRPKIGLAGMVDSMHSSVQVTLRVTTDATGKVTNVDVAKSSGSNEIDQPCRVSMYDWWFEPKRDATGQPVPDRFNFTIGFQ